MKKRNHVSFLFIIAQNASLIKTKVFLQMIEKGGDNISFAFNNDIYQKQNSSFSNRVLVRELLWPKLFFADKCVSITTIMNETTQKLHQRDMISCQSSPLWQKCFIPLIKLLYALSLVVERSNLFFIWSVSAMFLAFSQFQGSSIFGRLFFLAIDVFLHLIFIFNFDFECFVPFDWETSDSFFKFGEGFRK